MTMANAGRTKQVGSNRGAWICLGLAVVSLAAAIVLGQIDQGPAAHLAATGTRVPATVTNVSLGSPPRLTVTYQEGGPRSAEIPLGFGALVPRVGQQIIVYVDPTHPTVASTDGADFQPAWVATLAAILYIAVFLVFLVAIFLVLRARGLRRRPPAPRPVPPAAPVPDAVALPRSGQPRRPLPPPVVRPIWSNTVAVPAPSAPAGIVVPGWYPDPSTGGRRWWDGARWTDRTSP